MRRGRTKRRDRRYSPGNQTVVRGDRDEKSHAPLIWLPYTDDKSVAPGESMYILKVLGMRRSVLAYHHCDSDEELQELLAVYHALGYAPDALIVEEQAEEQAA